MQIGRKKDCANKFCSVVVVGLKLNTNRTSVHLMISNDLWIVLDQQPSLMDLLIAHWHAVAIEEQFLAKII